MRPDHVRMCSSWTSTPTAHIRVRRARKLPWRQKSKTYVPSWPLLCQPWDDRRVPEKAEKPAEGAEQKGWIVKNGGAEDEGALCCFFKGHLFFHQADCGLAIPSYSKSCTSPPRCIDQATSLPSGLKQLLLADLSIRHLGGHSHVWCNYGVDFESAWYCYSTTHLLVKYGTFNPTMIDFREAAESLEWKRFLFIYYLQFIVCCCPMDVLGDF